MRNLQLRYDRANDLLMACTPDGKCVVGIQLQPIRRAVMNYLNYQTGWGWSSIKKAAGRITKKVGAKKLYRAVRKIAKDPRVLKGLTIASQIYPPLGITYAAVQKSAALLEAAKSGDLTASEKITQLVALAAQDNKKAAKVLAAMRAMRLAEKTGQISSVMGWASQLTETEIGNQSGMFSAYYRGIQ